MIKVKANKQMSDSMMVAFFLTLAGGFQDAYSYNNRGKVFANAQTGNIVLLGQNLAAGDFHKAMRYFIPLLAFISGVYITEWICHAFKKNNKIHWRQIVLFIEIVFLFLVGLLPQSYNILANVMMSFSCAMQVNSFRKFDGISCATTMCIGNLRSATEMLGKYHIKKEIKYKEKSKKYYLIITIFAAGAVLGALMSDKLDEKAIWIAMCFLLISFSFMFIKEEMEEKGFHNL